MNDFNTVNVSLSSIFPVSQSVFKRFFPQGHQKKVIQLIVLCSKRLSFHQAYLQLKVRKTEDHVIKG